MPRRSGVRRDGEPVPYERKTSRYCHCEPVRTLAWQSVTPVPISNVFKWQFENTTIFNFQLSIFNSPAAGCMWRTMFAATDGLQRSKRMAGRLPALQAGAGGERRDGEPVPYGRKTFRSSHFERSEKSVSPSPFPMFSNGNLKTPPFSTFNFQFARRGLHVANSVRRYGRACSGRGAWPADCRRYRRVRAGYGGTGNPSPTGGKRSVPVISSEARNPYPRPHFQCFQMAI